ncbi:MAG: alpha/beta family hydrolase [Pseudomonadota bacterium]
MIHQRNQLIDGAVGQLETIFEQPDDVRAVGLVCHPHPQFQGAMTNKVAHTLARAMLDEGVAALRFNFRGVGQSEGDYDHGVGEVADALAAAEWLARQYPTLPMVISGFSFGARVAILAASRRPCEALISVAPAVALNFALPFEHPNVPWLVVQGDADELVACDDVIGWTQTLDPRPDVEVMAGVGHFFHANLTRLRERVRQFLIDGGVVVATKP